MHRLLSRNWLIKHTFALIILLTMIRLGFWQLDRLAEKRALNAATLTALDQPAIVLTGDSVDPDALHFRKVQVSGVYDNEQSIVLRNQLLDGVAGLHLITPLRINGSEQAVLIDRGWIDQGQAREEVRGVFAQTGDVTIEGIAFRSQERPDALFAPKDLPLPGETRIDAWMRVDIAKIQEQIDAPLLPVYIAQMPGATPPLPDQPRPESAVKIDEGSHLSYAIQWFSFSVILIVVYALLIRQELRKQQ